MSQAEVEQILSSSDCYERAYKWCGSHKVNTTKTSRGTHEQWVWVNVHGMPLWYMYFDNGILSAIQE